MPDWPPKDFDYSAALARRGLRKVEQKYWKVEPEEKDGKRVPKYSRKVNSYYDRKEKGIRDPKLPRIIQKQSSKIRELFSYNFFI